MIASAATRERVAAFLDSDYPRVVRTVAAATGDSERAEDAVQDAIVHTLTRADDPDNMAAWITVVAINFVKQNWRREGAQTRAYVKACEFNDGTSAEANHVIDTVAVSAALEALPERQRLTVILHYYQGLSIEQIARVLEVSTGTVKTQLSRGRHALAHELGSGARS